jgi:1,4-alpha-glucan branching enzyme
MPKRKPAGATGQPRSARRPAPASRRFTDDDHYLFHEGTHFRLYNKLGAHPGTLDGKDGVSFGVWAPGARSVSVVGDWNDWQPEADPLVRHERSGVWEGFVAGAAPGALYKYHVSSKAAKLTVDKADPFAFRAETPPQTASVVARLDYDWGDAAWMGSRRERNALDAPQSIYELHLGSWKRGEGGGHLGYRELAAPLIDHVTTCGFTHVELLPVMEHPFYGSWGYQVTGYFAPTSRYGGPQDLMFLIDRLHQAGIGVILDWVPSHFPGDEHGLRFFDGTYLFEHADPRLGFHPDWTSYIFNYGRKEVRSFLVSSALFWLDKYHADGLRVDGVASMLYLDYSRDEGEWVPNEFGGRENLGAIEFLRELNKEIYEQYPDVQTVAEESTAWPMVSRPVHLGGLGFGMKWDMGWMHDTLEYFKLDPVHRKFHHQKLTFRPLYAGSENFVLSLSHDEVVHGKGSLLGKLAGDVWQKHATLRALYGYMYALPGKKLLFMGSELAPWNEWDHEQELPWHLLDHDDHAGTKRWIADLNCAYKVEAALQHDYFEGAFEWIDANDLDNSVLTFLRRSRDGETLLVVCNFTPVPRQDYRVGMPAAGHWVEVLNSDGETYGGSGEGNPEGVDTEPVEFHGRPCSAALTLPPLATVFLRRDPDASSDHVSAPTTSVEVDQVGAIADETE